MQVTLVILTLGESDQFQQAEAARQQAIVERDNPNQPIQTNWGNLWDLAFKYMSLLFREMDPEGVFTFMIDEDAADMLTFLMEQMSKKEV